MKIRPAVKEKQSEHLIRPLLGLVLAWCFKKDLERSFCPKVLRIRRKALSWYF